MALVFQYGSNTNSARLNAPDRLQGTAVSRGLARTVDRFNLDFSCYSPQNGCAAASLTPGSGRQVFGVLYDVPDERVFRHQAKGWRTLDEIEREGTAYGRTRIRVVPAAGDPQPLEALTYLVLDPRKGLKTSREYVRHIVTGLREHGAPEDYLGYVKERACENNPDLAAEVRQP